MAISLLAYVTTFSRHLYFWRNYIFTLLQSNNFDTIVTFPEQLLLQSCYFFLRNFRFQNSRHFAALIFQNSSFFRTTLLPGSHFLRIDGSLECRHFRKSYFFGRGTSAENQFFRRGTFWKIQIYRKSNIPHCLLFLDS